MDQDRIGEHISKQFDHELEDIRNRVLLMGGLVEQQVSSALQVLVQGDIELGEEVIFNDYKVNSLEVAIDEECSQILARRQPAAIDLRMIIAVIKTITDLERIGDEAARIARQGMNIASQQTKSKKGQFSDLEQLGNHVLGLLRETLDSFARLDVDLALAVVQEDEKVDREYESILRQQMTYLMEDPRSIPVTLEIMWSARALERVGDRACNICEYVIYQVKGKDIRHISVEEIKQNINN